MILVCGETLFDLFPAADGEHQPAGHDLSFRAIAGGSPFNVALGLARFRRSVALSTTLGQDSLGARAFSMLTKEGVDTRFVRQSGTTPLAFVDLAPNGSPTYSFAGFEQAIYHPDPELAANTSIDAVHVGSLAIVSSASAEPLLAFLDAQAPETLISLDPNIRLKAEPEVSRWHRAIEAFRGRAHLIKVSEEDLQSIYGAAVNPQPIAESWLSGRTQLIVVTKGAGGASLFSRQHGRTDIVAAPVEVADTVGAGDSFQAALLCWLDEKGLLTPDKIAAMTADDVGNVGRFSVLASSLTCSKNGPDLPFRTEMARQ